MKLVLSTFALIFVAELADKSRLVGLMLVASFRRPWPVFIGMTLGFLVLDGAAVVLGARLAGLARPDWLRWAAGAAFILAGAASLGLPEDAHEQAGTRLEKWKAWGPLAVSFVAVSASEIFDRTQIACAVLAADTGRPAAVLLGAIAALALLNALTVAAGEAVLKKVPLRAVYRVSAVLFIATGVAVLFRAF